MRKIFNKIVISMLIVIMLISSILPTNIVIGSSIEDDKEILKQIKIYYGSEMSPGTIEYAVVVVPKTIAASSDGTVTVNGRKYTISILGKEMQLTNAIPKMIPYNDTSKEIWANDNYMFVVRQENTLDTAVPYTLNINDSTGILILSTEFGASDPTDVGPGVDLTDPGGNDTEDNVKWINPTKTGTYTIIGVRADGTTGQIDVYREDQNKLNYGYENETDLSVSPYNFVLHTDYKYYVKLGEYVDIQVKYAHDRDESYDEGNHAGGNISNHKTLFEALEFLISSFIIRLANAINWIVSKAVGKAITIDDIVFNKYEEIRLDFFKEHAEKNTNTSTVIKDLSNAINTLFGIFRNIAILGYLLIILYIGIRVMIGAGAGKKAQYKDYLKSWIIGLAILFFYPYVLKYAININNALVMVIDKSKIEKIPELANIKTEIAVSDADYDEKEDSPFDRIPFSSKSNDYMTTMAKKAYETRRLSYAVVYLIMVIQLVFILVIYYKRLFMVALLIITFPLVALMYAIDKMNGKAETLNIWTKEIMLNIFVQVFHAIIYVFCLGAVYAGGANGNDWILMIVGVTFLFGGEEIIKKIFGQSSPAGSVKSLGETATKIIATTTVTKNVAKSIVGNVSTTSRNLMNSIRDRRKYGAMISSIDRYGSRGGFTSPHTYSIPSYMDLPSLPENATADERNFAQAVQIYNNRHIATPEQLANSLNTLEQYRNAGGSYSHMLDDLDMSHEQLEALSKLNNNIASQVSSGSADAKTISQNIKAEIDYIFDADEVETIHKAVVTQMSKQGVSQNRVASEKGVRQELNDAKDRVRDITEKIKFKPVDKSISKKEITDETYKKGDRLYRDSIVDVSALSTLSEEEKDVAKRFARNVAIIEAGKTGQFREDELMQATEFLINNRDSNEITRSIVQNLEFDIDEYKHALSKKVLSEVKTPKTGANKTEQNRIKLTLERSENALAEYEVDEISEYEAEDKISAHEIIRQEVSEPEEEMKIVERVSSKRRAQNQAEIEASIDIAKQILELENIDTKATRRMEEARQEEPTLEGMTREQLEIMKEASNRKLVKNVLGVGNIGIGSSGSKEKLKLKTENIYTGEKQVVDTEGLGVVRGVTAAFGSKKYKENIDVQAQFVKKGAKKTLEEQRNAERKAIQESIERDLRDRYRGRR